MGVYASGSATVQSLVHGNYVGAAQPLERLTSSEDVRSPVEQ